MTEKLLLGWTILAGLANVGVGVYVATGSLYGGILVISHSLMILGLGGALYWESLSRSASTRAKAESLESTGMVNDGVEDMPTQRAA